MPNVTQLTSTVESAFLGLGSLDLYCVYDGADYRIKPETLQQIIGRKPGACLATTTTQSVGQGGTGRRITWESVVYDDGGYTNIANSPSILTVPDNVALVTLGFRWRPNGGGSTTWGGRILQQNSFNNGKPWYVRYGGWWSTAFQYVYTHPIAVEQGEIFTAAVQQDAISSAAVNSQCLFWITPYAYR